MSDHGMCSFHPHTRAIQTVSGEGLCVDCVAACTCPVCGDIEFGRHVADEDILVMQNTGTTVHRLSCSMYPCPGTWYAIDETPRGLAWYRYVDADDANQLWNEARERLIADEDSPWDQVMIELARIADTVNPW